MGGLRVLFTAADIAARVDTLAMEVAGAMPADFVIVGLVKSGLSPTSPARWTMRAPVPRSSSYG